MYHGLELSRWVRSAWALEGLDFGFSQSVTKRLEGQAIEALGARPESLTPRGAFALLLRGRSAYDVDFTGSTLASFKASLVSLPSSVRDAPKLEDLLDDHDRSLLDAHGSPMFAEREQVAAALAKAPPRPYCDPVLMRRRGAYVTCLKLLHARGMLRFSAHVHEHCGVFFVTKKSGMIRMI